MPRNRCFPGKKRRAGWGKRYFYSYFRRLQKAAENTGFFPRLTPQVSFLFALTRENMYFFCILGAFAVKSE